MENFLSETIERTLEKYKNSQVNLLSKQARIDLAKEIMKNITAKFYLVSYCSQESYE